MNFDIKQLYELLPALYRIRDTELAIKMLSPEERAVFDQLPFISESQVNGPIKSLLSIIAEQVVLLEENLDQLYDDQFIETCAEWVVPYIGQLVGTRGLLSIENASFSERGEVANTIAYRRRKGTASVLEQLAHDVTGWDSNVVEYFERLATTQYMNHLRPENLAVTGLKKWELLEYAQTPFDRMPHTVDVRNIQKQRGKYNIPNIGIFLWRLNAYTLEGLSPAYKVDGYRYTFDALGKSLPLYNSPQTEELITHLAEPINVPIPLSRNVLSHYLDTYYGKEKSVWVAAYDVNGRAIDTSADAISICNLSDMPDGSGNWAHTPATKIAIDPVLGRIAFPTILSPPQLPPAKVAVHYYTAFSADMGGGGYERAHTFTQSKHTIYVPYDPKITPVPLPITIQDALNQLHTLLLDPNKTKGVIEIIDNAYYFEDLVIKIPKGKTIEIRASDKHRPVLVLNTDIRIEAEADSTLIFNGLLISGGLILSDTLSKLQYLRLVHCTLAPGSSPAWVTIPARPALPRLLINSLDTQVEIEKSIVGAMRICDGAGVRILDSIVDASAPSENAYSGVPTQEAGGTLHVENSTIIGQVHTLMIKMASNSIFYATPTPFRPAVLAKRLQQGCVRFSYLPPGSKIPRPYRCQPEKMADATRVKPMFTSLKYGDAAYGQLHKLCAKEIAEGADDTAEMGAFHQLYQPQRVANLRTRLDEYLRFGLEAGIFFAS